MVSTWPPYVYATMVLTTYYTTCTKTNNQVAIQEVTISNLCQRYWYEWSHQRFKKAIKTINEIMEVNIINLFGFTFKDNISKWGENFVQDHPNYTFEELEQAFCKQFRIVVNDEKVYM